VHHVRLSMTLMSAGQQFQCPAIAHFFDTNGDAPTLLRSAMSSSVIPSAK